MKLQNLRNEEVNEQLRDMLLSANKRFNELYGYFNKGIMALLKWWGDPESIMQSYIRAIEEREAHEKAERERKEREEKERQRREIEEKERKDQEERDKRQREHEEKMRLLASMDQDNLNEEDRRLMLGYDSADQNFRDGSMAGSKAGSVRNSMAVLPYTGGKIQNLKNQRANQQIEKIKRNKQEKEEQKRLEEERKRLQSERKHRKLKEQLEKRKLELGIGSSNLDTKALIYKDGSVLAENDKLKRLAEQKLMIPQISLIDLDQEEERDKEAVLMYMKKYAKLWRNLYYKYCNSGYSSKQINNFDQLNEKSQTINAAEMTKLLKDHGTFPNLINKSELQQLFRLINTKLFSRSDLQALDYNGYFQFMMQLAFYCFSKPPKDLSHLPPVESIRALIAQFEQATRARGNSTVLYEDPDATSIGDSQLIKALNEKLLYDPNYPIPEGYFKQTEKTPIYEYRISDQVAEQLPESQVVSVELLDDLLNNLIIRLKVRPLVKNLVKPQAEALNYMKKVEKRVKPQDTLNPYTSLSALEKLKANQEVKPIPNVTLKLEVAQYPLKERPHAQEVAEVLEEILQATEKGLTYLPPRAHRAPGQVWNEAKAKKEEDSTKTEEIKNQKEELRKKRDNQLKNELQKIKEDKGRDFEEQRKQREEKERQEKENQRRQQEEIRRKLDNKKKQIEDQKNTKLEEIMKKRQEEEEKNREMEEKKKKERAEFMKRQKQKLEEEFQAIGNERKELAAKQQELSQKEKEYQQRIKANMENFIKESQQDRLKEHEERVQIKEFLKQPDVENIFALYDKSLRHMFKFYASQDKKDLDFNMDRVLNTINFREFIRFNYQQYVVPCLLPPEDGVQIFRQLIREMIDEKTQANSDNYENYLNDKNNAQVLDYEMFKKSLVRIAIMAQDQLGGQREDLLLEKLEQETKKRDENRRRDQARKQQQDGSTNQAQNEEETKGDGNSNTGKGAKDGGNGTKGTDDQEKTEVGYEISQTQKAKEDAFFDKWMKDRESKGISLKKRIIGKEKDGGKKTVVKKKKVTIQGKKGGLDGVREGEDIEDGADGEEGATSQTNLNGRTIGGSAIVRKTKALKALKELEQQEAYQDQFANTKIENKKIRKDLNVIAVSPKTLEALLRFLELYPEDTRQNLDNKLNQHRIEIQGQKPNRLKMQIKPNKLETVKPAPGQALNQSIEEQQPDYQQQEADDQNIDNE